MKTMLAVLLALFLLPVFAQAEVTLNTRSDFRGYTLTLKYSCFDLRPCTFQYPSVKYTGRDQWKETKIWVKKSFNDQTEAVEITNNEKVVLYEHLNCRGRSFAMSGNGRHILPPWFRNRATSVVINGVYPPPPPPPSKEDLRDYNGPPDHRRN